MALIETLTFEIGASIAKAVVKFWMKDSNMAADVGADLLDLIKTQTKDVFDQQEAKRQFEAIGQRVARDLLPIFEREAAKLDEPGQTAVAQMVRPTARTARVSDW